MNQTTAPPDTAHATPKRASGWPIWAVAFVWPAVFGPAWLALAGQWFSNHWFSTFNGAILASLLVVTAVSDWCYHKIPNWATYTAFVWALVSGLLAYYNPTLGGASEVPLVWVGSPGLLGALLGAAVGFFVMLFIHSLSAGGAGDVKLMTAVGALVGYEYGFLSILFGFMVAAVGTVGKAIWEVGPWTIGTAFFRRIASFLMPNWYPPPTESDNQLLNQKFPLAPYFAVGTVIALWDAARAYQ